MIKYAQQMAHMASALRHVGRSQWKPPGSGDM